MKHSSWSVTKVASALVAIQAELRAIAKDGKNPHFNSKFVTFDAIVEHVRPIAARYGCAIVQDAEATAVPGVIFVSTTVVHESGEWIAGGVPVRLAKDDPQGLGSAVTYAKRYGAAAMFFISADEDDDGNAASKPARASTQKSKPIDGRAHIAAPVVDQSVGTATARPEDVKVKGVRLADMSLPKLREVLAWAQETSKDSLIAASSAVINHKVAENDEKTKKALRIDDTSIVKRMIDAEDDASRTLPFSDFDK